MSPHDPMPIPDSVLARCVGCKQRVGGIRHLKLKPKAGQKRALCQACVERVRASEEAE